jgi:hypothetical protein
MKEFNQCGLLSIGFPVNMSIKYQLWWQAESIAGLEVEPSCETLWSQLA